MLDEDGAVAVMGDGKVMDEDGGVVVGGVAMGFHSFRSPHCFSACSLSLKKRY
jgi:hypothetical protein